jgi:hypothetical protein
LPPCSKYTRPCPVGVTVVEDGVTQVQVADSTVVAFEVTAHCADAPALQVAHVVQRMAARLVVVTPAILLTVAIPSFFLRLAATRPVTAARAIEIWRFVSTQFLHAA